MTKLKLAGIFLFAASLVFNSCTSKQENSEESQTETATAEVEEALAKTGKEYTSAYICPMHCEGSGSDEPGKCPVCEMDYEKNESQGS